MMVAGARSCVLKADVDGAFVADTLAMVGRYGATVVDPAVSTRFRAEAGYRLRLMPDAPEEQRLSERERAVLRLLADGCTDQAAAARLGISDSTVRSYIGRACAKLGATTREQLMVLATRQGLLDG
jgi:DNA-binding NarL/FixJ family response regulator